MLLSQVWESNRGFPHLNVRDRGGVGMRKVVGGGAVGNTGVPNLMIETSQMWSMGEMKTRLRYLRLFGQI